MMAIPTRHLADPAGPWLTVRQPEVTQVQSDQGQSKSLGHGGKI